MKEYYDPCEFALTYWHYRLPGLNVEISVNTCALRTLATCPTPLDLPIDVIG